MGTSRSPTPLSSSTFARLSLDSGWTCPNMQGTLSIEEQPLGLCHRALTQIPSSFLGTGTQTAIIDMLTNWHLSSTPWLPWPFTHPGRDPLSLPVLLGRTWSSELDLGGAPGPSAMTADCCAGDTAAVGGLGASLSSFEDLMGLCLQST
ncbi:hypothetical protein NDA14_001941 [Ustilago hordei]|uniref:Uncharacterized protein n=1 Tax=Ustilago hordei TaxID=120017 RepID=I2G4N5_USTHO|nr:uncharacterized protein UHO2_01272 [Ustilago hordei]KAJ1044570.1 hypothetical protein NDA10_006844 [Ustilago hordei]KAJ1602909.1 hypothetical protein NDA14_001941 [Ustilago hordei]CCF54128.1 uncharacterized protein UHOR_00604 [Ustilago hordei]SYW74406.1 uncharacterized protein UHO2_01272 [Ustilago hordei]